MNKSIYHIEKEYALIAEELIENGGEITPEIATALQINEQELQVKATNYAFVIKQMIGDVDLIEAEIKRLQALKKSKETVTERLKETIQAAMEHHGILKIETPLIKLSFRKSESVEILDEEMLNSKYITSKTTHAPNKTAIKEAIKAGEIVEGAALNQNQSLQIK